MPPRRRPPNVRRSWGGLILSLQSAPVQGLPATCPPSAARAGPFRVIGSALLSASQELHMSASIRLKTAVPGPLSRALAARRDAAVPRGIGHSTPVYAESARGALLTDVDGNVFIDFAGGIGTLNAGHANPEVVRAAAEQLSRMTHTCFSVAPYEGYVALAETLEPDHAGPHAKKTMLANSGAEALENAVKIARHATGRDAVVVFEHAFHGRTLLTMSMTSQGPALQVRLRALRRRDLPAALPLRIPRPLRRPGRRRGRARGVLQDPGGRRESRLRRRRARARRGRIHRRAARLGRASSPGSAASTGSCSSSTRSRRDSDGPGGCSRPSTTTSSPTS